jgi:hypothetical protein
MEKLLKKKSFVGLSNSNLFGFAGVDNSKRGPTLTLLTGWEQLKKLKLLKLNFWSIPKLYTFYCLIPLSVSEEQ